MLVTLVRACELCVAFGRNNIAFGRCHHYIRVQPALCLCEDPIHSRCHHYIRVQPALCLCEDPIHSRTVCEDCGQQYCGRSADRRHVVVHHGRLGGHQCTDCGRVFSIRSHLQGHHVSRFIGMNCLVFIYCLINRHYNAV
ncbi:zinc finger and SCAN domain-containing protein 26-like isoform X1 [Gigantopelta aegis]|uniref:zinc finger and SCAN domain-containing protein 26-like isoform X1 n=1 Tax=Gigantopelta aegis TaxID=1735272 RepID=UPI001B88D852|nr:zinc finger and SCAN domain-containing protein 26-like isoform X1 [Gigantopelta aegis]